MPLPSRLPVNEHDFALQYRNYFSSLKTEQAKINFLLMLKERRDSQRDPTAALLLPELTERWITERWTA